MKEVTVDRILKIINANIENDTISTEQIDKDLVTKGMDSVAFIRIIVSLEEEFECEIPDSKLLISEMKTVNLMYDVLTSIEFRKI